MTQPDAAIEALLIVATEAMSEIDLAAHAGCTVEQASAALARLAQFYDDTDRGFELRQVAEGWRYYTRRQWADVIAHYALEGRQSRLTQASLETLAVIAYLQPISRARVAAVRGVNVDSVVRTLLARGLVQEVDRDEGGAGLLGTTAYFLERLGLASLSDLPPLAPLLPDATSLDEELRHLVDPPEVPDGP